MIRSSRRLLAALALVGTALSSPVLAQTAPATFPSEGTLAHTAIPTHYAISIQPDARALTFTGTFSIDVDVPQATDAVVLNAASLIVGGANLVAADGKTQAMAISGDSTAQTVRLAVTGGIAPGHYRIDGHYTGQIDTQAAGLFALDYTGNDGKPARALFTQFEPSYARQFAPMFDEPAYKATFDLSAVVPQDQMAVSNMPVASETPAGAGLKRVTFATTPRMSAYLLFFGAGDFERLTKMTSVGVEAGIVAPRGSGEQSRYALDELAQLIPYYNDYFGVNYPLPKIDNVAGPGQSQFFGAMENWGAVFTFQQDLLGDPAQTTPQKRETIAVDEEHEVAHQWFGDLVTMTWWDDLWLNEGFASWMETKAADHFHPDWSSLLTRIAGREQAMALDAYRTTHPIVQHIRTVDETNQAFDAITYQKGEAVLAMLEAYAGEDTWRAGIRAYMAEHKFANSHTIDLWKAVEGAGATGLISIADDFTTQPGIPLVRVADQRCANGKTTLSLTQDEFTRDRIGTPTSHFWHVPLRVSIANGASTRSIMQNGHALLTLDGCGPVMINAGQLGYYRSLYTPEGLIELTDMLPKLAPIDQLGLVTDQLELSYAGYQPLAPSLNLLAAVPADGNARVAEEAVSRFAALYDQLDGDHAGQAALAARAIALWKPRLDALGYDPRPSDTLPEGLLRSTLVASFGRMGEPGVVAEAHRRFAALRRDSHALDGPLKQDWLGIVARNAKPAEWERLLALAKASTSAADRIALFNQLAAARNPALARRTLDLALTNIPGKTVSAGLIEAVSTEHSELAFDFFVAHRDAVMALIDASGRTRYAEKLARTAHTASMVDKLIAYKATVPADAKAPVDSAISKLKGDLSARGRIMAQTLGWLKVR